MTLLQIMDERDATDVRVRTRDAERVAEELAPHGVEFTRWEIPESLQRATSPDEVLACFETEVAQMRRDRGFTLVDVAALSSDPSDPEKTRVVAQAREKFLDEHRHDEHEVRFFASGRGCFYLHVGGTVAALVCEAGDVVSVPAGTPHWYDMGETPAFTAIRFFEQEDGWVGDFTGDGISSRFPTIDELMAAA